MREPARPIALALLVSLGTGCGGVIDGLSAHAPPENSESARRWNAGPFPVAAQELRFVDDSRPTMANGDDLTQSKYE
ncbi:MAG: hypothetical protein ABFS41_07450 [Myxococcota bacterium]